ncbi:MAG TPA: DNA primase large subunit PriL [Methanocorpusculum sp.]|nr:DNA primase large subunit PriL [Methanocorpusculum sp.]
MPAVDLRDLSHYPFLPEAQKILASRGISIDRLSTNPTGLHYLEKATERVQIAIDGKEIYPEDTAGDNISDIVTYVLARILVSCLKDRRIIDRFVRGEAKRAYTHLLSETNISIKNRVCGEFGIPLETESLSVLQYLQMAGKLNESKWQLINRDVIKGRVLISPDELEILLGERIRLYLGEKLPIPVPKTIECEFSPWTDSLSIHAQKNTLQEYGTVNESAFPPCIQALIQSAERGENLVHAGRFTMVAFLRTIGMSAEQIEGIFSQSPDYNAEMTEYQVNHILGNEYVPLACLKMLTNGLCVHKDKLCNDDKINHPLSYYKKKNYILEQKKKLKDKKATENKSVKKEEVKRSSE